MIYCLLDTKHYLKNTLLALGVLTILKFLLMIIMTFVNSRTKSDWRTWPKVLRKPPLTKTNRRRKPRWWKRSWKRLLSSERYVLFAKFTHYIEFWHSTLRIHQCTIWFLVFRFWKERDRDASRFTIPMSAALWRYPVVVQWRQPLPLTWDLTTTTSDGWCWPSTGPTVWGRGEFPWLLIALMDWKVSLYW